MTELSFEIDRYGSAKAMLGEICVGGLRYNEYQSRTGGENSRYIVYCLLPGLKSEFTVPTENEGKELLQKCLKRFLKRTGLEK